VHRCICRSSTIREAIRYATQHQSLKELKEISFPSREIGEIRLTNQHDFLPKKPLVGCLKPHIFCALRAAGAHWDIISLP
jgi:hypothetical protein